MSDADMIHTVESALAEHGLDATVTQIGESDFVARGSDAVDLTVTVEIGDES